MQWIDCHTHAWTREARLAADRHYTPERVGELGDLEAALDATGVAKAVLVQPSFLDDDNQVLLASLQRGGERFAGVCVMDLPCPESRLLDLDRAGVRAIRFNLIGTRRIPDVRSPDWRRVIRFMQDRAWHVVLVVSGERLPAVCSPLMEMALPVVVDHYALPSAERPSECPGMRFLADRGDAPLFIKASGAYRLKFSNASDVLEWLAARGFRDRWLWGSDWPFTRHEADVTYAATRATGDAVLASGFVTEGSLAANAERLYFSGR